MTDRQTYKSTSGAKLTLRQATSDSLIPDVMLFLMVDGRGMFIPAGELLAMIDTIDPDAMRAYLRETAPEVIADLYRPAPAAAEHFDYLDAIPEDDSPEDVDERRHCDPLTAEQLADLRDAGRTLGEAWRTFGAAVREGMQR